MEAEFAKRRRELLVECEVTSQIFDRVLPRLEWFMEPFIECLVRSEQREHANTFVRGLLSDLEHKNVESIAYRFGQERMPLQWFVGGLAQGSGLGLAQGSGLVFGVQAV